jgi:hypothetical protein
METEEFQKNLEELIGLAEKEQVAIMCAEAIYFRCHRHLISDALLVRGIQVEHITSLSRSSPHKLTPWARAEGGKVIYPGPIDPDPLLHFDWKGDEET